MDRAISIGRTSATGSIHLFIGRIASTLVLAVGSIIVGLYISEGDYGLYSIALVPAATLLLFQDWGVGQALTKYCANYRATRMEGELRSLVVAGLTFAVLTGLALTLFLLVISNVVAVTIFAKPESAFLIAVSSLTIFSTAVYVCTSSVIVGFERMGLSSVTMIISSCVQGLLSPFLVYLGFGAFGAVVGYTSAGVASAITGVLLLYFSIFRKLPVCSINKPRMSQTIMQLLRFGVPLSIAAIIGGVSTQIYYFVMASTTDVSLIGNYSIATNFTVFITFFLYPLQTVLFPAFSKLSSMEDKQLIKTIYPSSVKYSSLFLVPVTMAIMVLSVPMVSTIYGNKWLSAPFFLTFLVAGNLVVLLGNLSFSRLLFAMGETKILLKLAILTLCVGAPLAFLLIPPFGIVGVIIVALIASFVSLIVGVYWTWKHYESKPDFRNSAKIFLASTIASLITFLFLQTFVAPAWIMLTTGAILFLLIYLFSIPLVGAINLVDTNNLRFMFSEIGVVSKFLEVPFAIIEKQLHAKEKHFKMTNKGEPIP